MYTLLLLIPLSTGGVFFLRQAYRLGPGNAAGSGLNRSERIFYITVNLTIGLWFIFCPVLAFLLYTFR
jgi:hypothetical protein